MKRFTALALTTLLSVSLGGCTEGDDAPPAAQPNAAGAPGTPGAPGANGAKGGAPQAPNAANNAHPGTESQLTGTWNYLVILAGQDGQQQEIPATGTLVMKADNIWSETLSVAGQPTTQSQGTFSVQGDQVTVKEESGQQFVASFQIGEAEAPNGGGKKPALILKRQGPNGVPLTIMLVR